MNPQDQNEKPPLVEGAQPQAASRTLRRQPSIKDIARIARVSHPTVSRALQNSPLVNPKTAERIRQIAREAGYRPSAVARGLVTRHTRTIGLVATSIADPFTGEVASGIEQAARDLGYSVYFADSGADPEREKKVVQSLAEQRVDGIIVTSSRVGALHLPLLAETMVPVVLVNDQHPGVVAHSVLIDNESGMRLLAEHLVAHGHRRIAYIGDRFGYQSDTERFSGYRRALDGAGIVLRDEYVTHGDGKPAAAIEVMDRLLALVDPPTAVCCYNDMTALGALRAIHARGLHVPGDLSVTGFDDLFLAAYTEPPLTTMHQPMRRMGQLAMESLYKLMNGEQSVPRLRIRPELVARLSTGPARL